MPDGKSVSRGKEGVPMGGDVVADAEAGGRVFGGANNRAATHDAGGGLADGPRERVHRPVRTCGGFSSWRALVLPGRRGGAVELSRLLHNSRQMGRRANHLSALLGWNRTQIDLFRLKIGQNQSYLVLFLFEIGIEFAVGRRRSISILQ